MYRIYWIIKTQNTYEDVSIILHLKNSGTKAKEMCI